MRYGLKAILSAGILSTGILSTGILSTGALVVGLASGPSVAGETEKGGCMQSEAEIVMACRIEDPKASLAEDPCAIFHDVLAATYPRARLAGPGDADGAPPDVVLVIEQARASALAARIDWGDTPGQSQAMHRADQPLDQAAIAGFLERLLQANPRP